MVAGDRFVPAGEEPHEPHPARVRPAGGKHARAEAADQADDGTSTDAEPTEGQTGTEPAEDETEPADAQPTVPLPSGPSPGSDADGWLPFAASDEPASDRDRAAGLTAMILAAAVVAVCGVGGLLTILTGSGGEGAPATVAAARTSAPASASPSPTPSRAPAAVAPAASTTDKPTAAAPRATGTHAAARPAVSRPATPVRNRDREPLTIQEVFGSGRVIVQGREYRLVYTDGTTDCAAGARGTTAAELRGSGCTQLIRALAVDGSGRHGVTVGVANLPDAAAAGRVVATEHGRGGFAALWARRGRGAAGGDGYRETGAVGRFVVYGIAASSERGGAGRGAADRAAMQAVADLRAVVAARLRARG